MNRRHAVAALALILAGGAAYLSFNPALLTGQTVQALQIGAPFELASSRGGAVKSADLIGKPYGVFFGFTHCPEVCPTTMYEMTNTLEALGEVAKDFRLFFVTVDPERDTVKDLADYMSSFDSRMEGLVPTPAQLPGIARSFRVFYEKVPTSDGSYTMNHTATVFLFDRKGNFSGTIAFDEAKEARIAKIRRLLE